MRRHQGEYSLCTTSIFIPVFFAYRCIIWHCRQVSFEQRALYLAFDHFSGSKKHGRVAAFPLPVETMTSLPRVKIAACHAAPVFLNAQRTTEKALGLVDEAVSKGANLVVFPESYIPGFPLFASAAAPVDSEGQFAAFVEQSIYADGPEINALRQKAAESHVVISLGFSERSRASIGCIWNSNIVIGEDGSVLSHHRKMCPTYWEKLVWSNGDGYGLQVCETMSAGRVGALICGENTNPLARFAMMAQGEQIHIASFPPAWPTKRKGGYANRTANAVRAAAHSFEAKCFSVVCSGYLDEETKKITAQGDESRAEVLTNATQATTQFFGPDGVQIADELSEWEGIAYCEVDLNKCVEAKQLHDVVGGYQRYDIFDLRITRKRDEPVQWIDVVPPPPPMASVQQQRLAENKRVSMLSLRSP